MHDRAYALATGIFIVLALAVLAITVYWLAGADVERRPYVVVSSYTVAGLAEGSQVLYRGVPAGRVDRIRINPDEPSEVLIRISVDGAIPVRRATFARLHLRGLTGVAQIELDDTGEDARPLTTSGADPARIRMAPSLLDDVTEAGARALAALDELAGSLRAVLDEENVERVASILARADRALASLEEIGQTLEQDLPNAMEGAVRSTEAVTGLAERAMSSMDEVEALVIELRETAAVARRLGDELSGSTAPVDRALDAIDQAAREITRLAQSLVRQPEALWRGRQPAPGPGEE